MWSPREALAPCHFPGESPQKRETCSWGGTPGDLWGNWETEKACVYFLCGWAANPTDVLIPQWYGVNREEMALQVTEEENSAQPLLPVAPKRCGRELNPIPREWLRSYWEWQSALGSHTMEEQPCVEDWTEQTRWHVATFMHNSGCWGGFHDQRQDGAATILGGTHTECMCCMGSPLSSLPSHWDSIQSKAREIM